MQYTELTPDNKRKAKDKARQTCLENIMFLATAEEGEGDNKVTRVLTDIGPLDHDRVVEIHLSTAFNSSATLVQIMMDDELRAQFDQWVTDIAHSQTYEIAAPADEAPAAPPVVL